MCDFGTSLISQLFVYSYTKQPSVYNISVLSNIPVALLDALPPSTSSQRLRPLFTIGVHDIPFLIEDQKAAQSADSPDDESKSGWIACTTDSILAMKDTLWDMLITIPAEHTANAQERAWPVVECPRGSPIKATQRDLRRFNALRAGLAQLVSETSEPSNPRPESSQSQTSAVRLSTSSSNRIVQPGVEEAVDKIVEPQSWASLAYSGFMWWASAGEQLRSEEQEESSRDAALLANLSSNGRPPHSPMALRSPSASRLDDLLNDSIASLVGNRDASNDGDAHIELAIIAYFHRLTTQILSVLADLVDSDEQAYPPPEERYRDEDESVEDEQPAEEDEEDVLVPKLDSDDQEENDGIPPITVDSRAVETMGLDVWSGSDALFIQALMERYFGREATLEGKGVDVCGVRIC